MDVLSWQYVDVGCVLGYFSAMASAGLVGVSLALRADFRLRVALAGFGLCGLIAGSYFALDL